MTRSVSNLRASFELRVLQQTKSEYSSEFEPRADSLDIRDTTLSFHSRTRLTRRHSALEVADQRDHRKGNEQ